jgi:enoyl-CoA hydratase / 3-hydroxyacyl-CoA dehydrogenase
MGTGIAQTCAEGGFATIVREPTQELLDKGLGRISDFLAKGVDKGKVTPARRDQVWSRIKGTIDISDLADCDLVIEAIVEVRDAKRALFTELDQVCKPNAILATNTSSFRLADIASATQRRDRFAGLHYFFPSVINKLLEVVRTKDTRPDVVASLLNFARLTGKLPISVLDAPGFAVNRYFVPWLNEAARLLEEGIGNIATIDAAACEAFEIGMGPFALMNATGIPIAYHSAVSLAESFGDFYAPARLLREQFEASKLWELSGAVDSARKEAVAGRLCGVVFGIAAQLVNEGVATVEDTDRGATIGLRWTKGPFAMMNDLGLKRALASAKQIETLRPGFVPQLLKSQAKSGKPWILRDVRLAVDDAIAYITMSRPEALNALNAKVLHELKDVLAQVRANRAVLLSGEGNAFIAGADIKEMQALAAKPAAIRAFTDFGQGVLRDIETLPQPVIAAINGFALGGGLELALACDIRIASSEARMGFPEVGLGILPGFGGTQRSARLAGRGVAAELVFTGDLIDAEEAARIGLVNRVVVPAQLMQTARTMADRIASRAPLAVANAKFAILASQELPLAKGLVFEVDRVSEAMATPDRVEGMQAFIEKRKPNFSGRVPRSARSGKSKQSKTSKFA